MTPRLLVATDGGDSSTGAVRLACSFAARHALPLYVISVMKPPVATGNGSSDELNEPLHSDSKARESFEAEVRAQLDAVRCEAVVSRIETVVDSPAPAIVRHAELIDAELIVIGLARHGVAERWTHGETCVDVVRLAHVPVLAVPAETIALPKKAVVAIDFSEFSIEAAHRVAGLLGKGTQLHLVHVTWSPPGVGWKTEEVWLETYRMGAVARLQELAGELAGRYELKVETAILDGHAADEILRYADSTGADLVAAGSHGYGFLGRLVMGSVARHLLRTATLSVLIMPPRLEDAAAREGQATSGEESAVV